MAGATVNLFIDTNGFLHLRDVKDLPWRAVFPDAAVVNILVSSVVIEELDRHKTGANQRRRDRARLALQMIEAASQMDDFSLALRGAPVEVRIVVSQGGQIDWSQHPVLDPGRADDQLVAEAASHADGAIVFSHDTGPLIRARIARVEALKPPEDWFLPLEQTDDQRRIGQLERQLRQALSTAPGIVGSIIQSGQPTATIEARVPMLRPFDSATIDRLVNECTSAAHPSSFTTGGAAFGLAGYASAAIDEYAHRYELYIGKLRAYFSSLHERVAVAARNIAVDYIVTNDSAVAARHLRIEVVLEGEGHLFSRSEDAEELFGSLSLPEAPNSPKRSVLGLGAWDDLDRPTLSHIHSFNQPRDPTGFYWFDRPKFGDPQGAMQCEDFRATRVWEDTFWVVFDQSLPSQGSVHIEISATNMPAPVRLDAAISVCEHAADWSDEAVLSLLPDSVRSKLA